MKIKEAVLFSQVIIRETICCTNCRPCMGNNVSSSFFSSSEADVPRKSDLFIVNEKSFTLRYTALSDISKDQYVSTIDVISTVDNVYYIFSRISALDKLEKADISYNLKLKQIPTLPSFSHLKSLALISNGFATIPVDIFQLGQLEILDLSNNTIK